LEYGVYRTDTNVWRFDEVPLHVRTKLNLRKNEYGVDLILQW